MAHLALELLGPFRATLDGLPVESLNSNRLRALLAYLAIERGREHLREQVASLLWPERSDQEALSALRYALSKLHDALGDRRAPTRFLLATRTSVQFNTDSDHWLDVVEFEDLTGLRDLSGLTAAASLYRGPFLHGLSVRDSPALDDWLLQKDEEYRRTMLSVLGDLTVLQIGRGAYTEAARWARRQLELEPYREQAHRQLMLALALGRERSAALVHYEACRGLLARELDCEPEDETQALYAQIRDRTLSPFAPVSSEGEGSRPLRVSASPSLPASAGTKPPPFPPEMRDGRRFVAREQELARLGRLLDQALAWQGGIALIAGEAGSGKTALLTEFARRAGQAHGDLIAVRGRCNAYGGDGDPYLPFREMLQTLAGDVEAQRASGTLSPEQALRAWDMLPVVGAALVEHGPGLIGTFVPGEALLRRAEGFPSPQTGRPPGSAQWLARLRDMVHSAGAAVAPTPQPDLLAQVTQVLHVVSLSRPLLLAIDDLQWADGSTAALLFHLGRRLTGSRILLACAYRPETDPRGLPRPLGSVLQEIVREWGDIRVDLDEADGWGFVEAYVDAEPNCLGAAFRQALYEHTGGNPLFTAELLRSFEREGALVQDGAGRWIEAAGLNWDRLPPEVEAVIAEHLAGLSDEDRALLQAASVQGERFIAEVAAWVLGRGEEDVVQRLSGPLRVRHRLVEADRLERLAAGGERPSAGSGQRPSAGSGQRPSASSGQRPSASSGQRLSRYRFRHVLLQRSAYDSLDPVARARLHKATGWALEAIYAAPAGAEGEQVPAYASGQAQALAPALAQHFEAAGLPLPAARALHDAGRQAMALSDFRQALNHFDHGLALLADEPPSSERSEIERLLQAARLIPQRSLEGTGSSELEGALARARLAGAAEAQGQKRLMTLETEAGYLLSRGQFEGALGVVGHMLDLATEEGDEGSVAHARYWFGFVYNLMGDPRKAVSHFDWVFARQIPGGWTKLRAEIGYDLIVHALTFSGINQWFLGYPEQALRRSTRALTRALELRDLYGQAFTSACGSTTLFLLRNDAAALQERSELCRKVCEEHGLDQWKYFADVFLGWLAVMRGRDLTGIERMQRAMAAWEETGMVVGTDPLVVVLADGCLAAANRHPAGDNEQRARLLAIGLAAVERWIGPDVPCGQAYQAELHRLRGELLLARDGLAAGEEALTCFGQALALAREYGALAWELRAAMSLVRLRERQGEAHAAELAEARQCLREVYGRFTEGFDFPDLRDAAALIGE